MPCVSFPCGSPYRFPRSAARGRRHPVPALSVPAFPGRYGRIARNGSISAPNGLERRVCCGFCSGAEPKANHHGKKHQGYPHRAESAESLCGREPGTEPLHVLCEQGQERGIRAGGRGFSGDGRPGEGTRQALLQVSGGRRRRNYGGLPRRTHRNHADMADEKSSSRWWGCRRPSPTRKRY